jgi:hypothetical protein
MLNFIVTGLPRSGTTWIANWLTTDDTLCIHDPLYKHKLEELDLLQTDNLLGISCTAIWRFQDFLINHPARKIVIHRDLEEINDSLANEMGVDITTYEQKELLNNIDGMHFSFESLFDPVEAKKMYEYALQKPFDPVRHAYLVEMNVQPNFGILSFNREALNDFRRRIS